MINNCYFYLTSFVLLMVMNRDDTTVQHCLANELSIAHAHKVQFRESKEMISESDSPVCQATKVTGR